jgi:hypothetical protein
MDWGDIADAVIAVPLAIMFLKEKSRADQRQEGTHAEGEVLER